VTPAATSTGSVPRMRSVAKGGGSSVVVVDPHGGIEVLGVAVGIGDVVPHHEVGVGAERVEGVVSEPVNAVAEIVREHREHPGRRLAGGVAVDATIVHEPGTLRVGRMAQVSLCHVNSSGARRLPSVI
jgi:hypothetical protein